MSTKGTKGTKGANKGTKGVATEAQVATLKGDCARVVASIDKRAEWARNKGVDAQAKLWAKQRARYSAPAFVTALASYAGDVDLTAFASDLANNDDAVKSGKVHRERYIAQYALEKLTRVLDTIVTGVKTVDGYTNAVLLNIAKYQSVGGISFGEAVRCLTHRGQGKFDALDSQRELIHIKGTAFTTASTQASSTREALRIAGIITVTKGARGAMLALADTETAREIARLYGLTGEGVAPNDDSKGDDVGLAYAGD